MYLCVEDKQKKASVVISCIDKGTSCYFWKKVMISGITCDSDNQQSNYFNCTSNYQRKRKSKKGSVENCHGFCQVGGGREEEDLGL